MEKYRLTWGDFVKLFSTRTIYLLRAKPTISVDYLSKYNQLTKPKEYELINNAASDYEAAFNSFQEIPEEIKCFERAWPGDLSEAELETLEDWLAANSETLKQLNQATEKPYCWFERKYYDDSNESIDFPELGKLRKSALMLLSYSKWLASDGKLEQALAGILSLHAIGIHYSGPKSLIEQLVAMALILLANEAVLTVIDRCPVPLNTMSKLQDKLHESIKRMVPLSFLGEAEGYTYNWFQHCFTDDSNGSGFLIPKQLRRSVNSSPFQPYLCWVKSISICMSHPSRGETFRQYQKIQELLEKFVDTPPWKMNRQGRSYYDGIHSLTRDYFVLDYSLGSFVEILNIYHRNVMTGQAVLCILGILRFKNEKGNLPQSLDDCVEKGYLTTVPIDCYSGELLKYKVNKDRFILYSVGPSFIDTGGKRSDSYGEDGLDIVFWPVERF